MKSEKQILQDKAAQYGLLSLSNEELFKIIGYKGSDFYLSLHYRAIKEIVRREEIKSIVKISSSSDCYKILSFLEGLEHEEFWCIYTNRNNVLIKTVFISKGNLSGVVVNVPLILKEAINLNASNIILAHNHPSGSTRPSDQDSKLTAQIKQAARLFDINVLDHIIIGNKKFFSFADEGLM